MPNQYDHIPRRRLSTDGFLNNRAPVRSNAGHPIVRSSQVPRSPATSPLNHPGKQPVRPELKKTAEAAPARQLPNTDHPSLIGKTLPQGFGELPNAPPRHGLKEHHKKNWRRITKRSVLLVVVLFFIGGGWLGWKVIHNIDKVFGGNIITNAKALLSSTKLKGESQGRVNLLLAGDSADDPGHQGADLTDSVMVVSLDTKNNTGFMLSIPRDLWVDIPSLGHQKINAANDVTTFNEPGYPTGGMGQLQEIVEQDLGIPIDYYALIDYTAFRDAVDAVNGITINIQSPDPRGLYDPNTNLKLPNGEDTLTGQEALNLARARGDGYGAYGFPQADFDRTEHQRQMLVALQQKASTLGVLSNPIKISNLFDALGNNVHTNLNLADALRLVQLSKKISLNSLQSLTYSYGGTNPLLTGYLAPGGEDALIPTAGLDDFTQLQNYYQQLASTNPVVQENASVVILNASDVIGLAHNEEGALEKKGINVTSITDASNEYPDSMIVDLSNGKDPATKQLLQQVFSSNTSTVTSTTASTEASEASGYNANFVVILGKNWDNSQ